MAKFLTTAGNSYYIEQIILNAEKSLTIVTPYLKLSNTLLDRLKDADRLGIKMSLIYGKNELSDNERRSIHEIGNLEIYFCQNLHAKCYHNESLMIISSMNLYEFSEKNNREMGILVEKKGDGEIYRDTIKEIESIKHASKKQKGFDEEHKEVVKTDFPALELDAKYNEMYNFHLPALTKILMRKYPQHNVVLQADDIRIEDFPTKGIILDVTGRIDFKIFKPHDYSTLKRINEDKLENALNKARIYWNRPVINVYLEPKWHDEISINGLERKTRRFFEIIDTFAQSLQLN